MTCLKLLCLKWQTPGIYINSNEAGFGQINSLITGWCDKWNSPRPGKSSNLSRYIEKFFGLRKAWTARRDCFSLANNRKSRKTVAPLSGYSECRSGTLLFFGRGFLMLFLSLLRLFFSGRLGFGLRLRRFIGFSRSLGGLRCGAWGLGLYRVGFRNYRLRLHRRLRLGLFQGNFLSLATL